MSLDSLVKEKKANFLTLLDNKYQSLTEEQKEKYKVSLEKIKKMVEKLEIMDGRVVGSTMIKPLLTFYIRTGENKEYDVLFKHIMDQYEIGEEVIDVVFKNKVIRYMQFFNDVCQCE